MAGNENLSRWKAALSDYHKIQRRGRVVYPPKPVTGVQWAGRRNERNEGMSEQTLAELHPNGRTIFYEGDDPEGFRAVIRAEFGFDPAEHPGHEFHTGLPGCARTWDEEHGWSFHCPAEHLDAIYGDDYRFPMGS